MEQHQQEQHQQTPTRDPHDDTLGGIDGSPYVSAPNNGLGAFDPRFHHHQSQSLDQGLPSHSFDQGLSRDPLGQSLPSHPHDHGLPSYPIDQDLPSHSFDQGLPSHQDQGIPSHHLDQGLPSHHLDQGLPSHPIDQGLPSHSLDQGVPSYAPRSDDTERPSHYTTPPVSHAPNSTSRPSSRPPSRLSAGGDRNAQYQPSDYGAPPSRAAAGPSEQKSRDHVVIKVGMVGDAQIGKTSLMVKYVEGSWDEDYIQTLGVNFMEKTISIRNTEITFSIWDLGGQREFVNMLPLVCNDAVAILFMFDLTRKSTLNSIKEWYRQGRGFNKTAIPILVGTKYDHFVNFPREEQEEISNQVGVSCFTFSWRRASNRLRHGGSQRLCARRSSLAAPATASMCKR